MLRSPVSPSASTSPIIPPRPGVSKRTSESLASIPVIPSRPHRPTKSGDKVNEGLDSAQSPANEIRKPIPTELQKPNETIPRLSESGTPLEHQLIISSDEHGADILLEIASELNEESPIAVSPTAVSHIYDSDVVDSGEEEATHESSFEIYSTSPAKSDVDNKNSTTEPIIRTAEDQGIVEPSIETPSEQSFAKDDSTDSSVADLGDSAPENTPDISGDVSTPVIPSRPPRVGTTEENFPKAEDNDVCTKECEKEIVQMSAPEANTAGALKTLVKGSLPLVYEQGLEIDTPGHGINDDKGDSPSPVIKKTGEEGDSSESATSVSKSEKVPVEENSEPKSVDAQTADVQPIIPKRPTRSTTPKIPSRPVKQDLGISTHNVDTEQAKPEASDFTTAKKGPPPKPKRLSSRIAAFQKMFNQTPLEHTRPKPAPVERNKLSSNQTDFASNLQNVMGCGLPLPGMANPDMIKKSSPSEHSEKDKSSENTESAANTSIPRRARGPRGKRLPRLIQEAKIEVEPRFLVSVCEVWLVNLSKPRQENIENEDSREAAIGIIGRDDKDSIPELYAPDEGAKEQGESLSQIQHETPENTSTSLLTEKPDPVVSAICLGQSETGNLDTTEAHAMKVLGEKINSQPCNLNQSETNTGEGGVPSSKDSNSSFVTSSDSDHDDHPATNVEAYVKKADTEAYNDDAIPADDEVLLTSADGKTDSLIEDYQ